MRHRRFRILMNENNATNFVCIPSFSNELCLPFTYLIHRLQLS